MPHIQRSNILKMIKDQAPEDRKINAFPGPYKLECTPYHKLDFNKVTYRKCLEENKNTAASWFKLCKVIIIGDVSVGKTCIVNRALCYILVIVVVFDLNNMDSLSHSKTWLHEALSSSSSTCPFIFLVGSKLDLLKKYAYKNMEINAMNVAKKLNAEYWAISSKTGKNINNLFYRIAALTFDDSIKNELQLKQKVEIGTELI
ncbi:hypothetical protein NQ314_002635, partial [Rhamnusium bicolor]